MKQIRALYKDVRSWLFLFLKYIILCEIRRKFVVDYGTVENFMIRFYLAILAPVHLFACLPEFLRLLFVR